MFLQGFFGFCSGPAEFVDNPAEGGLSKLGSDVQKPPI